jgi:hypothetical protein
MDNPIIEKKIERFGRFWKREVTDRPLIGLRMHTYHPLVTFQGGPRSGFITPDLLRAQDYYADFERLQGLYDQSIGDEIHAACAFYGVPWLEAILGCPVEIRGGSMWAERYLDDWEKLDEIQFQDDNAWFLKLIELTEETQKYFDGRIPVGLPLLRGPADIAAALRGTDQFCMDLITEPDNVMRLLDICADTYIQVVKALETSFPTWMGGYLEPIRHTWAPGFTVETQVDVASLISPKHYHQYIRLRDAKVLGAFEYCYLHLHASSLHILDDVLSIDTLAALELSLDVGGPKAHEFIGQYKKILSQTPLILQGVLTAQEIIELCTLLPSEGLFILALADTPEEGNKILRDVQDGLGVKWFE